jgi:hypothetical protein
VCNYVTERFESREKKIINGEKEPRPSKDIQSESFLFFSLHKAPLIKTFGMRSAFAMSFNVADFFFAYLFT